jgi:preprotein translocase subunit YajC
MIDTAWAQASGAGGASPFASFLLPILLIFGVFYFLLIRPQQQRDKQHQTILANLKKNDKVVTSGGLHGRVTELGEDVITLEVAPNVRVRVSRANIGTVLTAPKAEDKSKSKESE